MASVAFEIVELPWEQAVTAGQINFFFAGVTLVISLGMGLLATEGVFRLFYRPQSLSPRMLHHNGQVKEWCCLGEVVGSGYFGMVGLNPGAVFKHCYDGVGIGELEPDHCVTYRINRFGLRDLEFGTAQLDAFADEGVFTVGIFGDSFTFGEGTQLRQIYPRLLDEHFRRMAMPSGSVRSVRVLNFGFPGTSTSIQYHYYEAVQESFFLDAVILQWNTNDVVSSEALLDHVKVIGAKYQKIFANSKKYEWSAVVHFIWRYIKMKGIERDLLAVTRPEITADGETLAYIVKFAKETRRRGQSFAMAIFPELISFDDYPYEEVINQVIDAANVHHIEVINLLPSLRQFRARQLWVHETDHHPNQIAHEIAYRQIKNYLEPLILEKGRR